jgi:hypothetical protein
MASENPSLPMLAPHQLALDHGDSADSGAQREHDHIGFVLRGTRVALTQQGQARVVFQKQGQAELLSGPAWQIEIGSIDELLVGGRHTIRAYIYQTAKAQPNPGDRLRAAGDQSTQNAFNLGQQRRERPQIGKAMIHGAENPRFLHQRTSDVRASQVNS